MMRLTIANSLLRLERDETDFVRPIEKDGFDVCLCRPLESHRQTPHTRDEIDIVAADSGEFICKGQRAPFGPGDTIFVPAGENHRFETLMPDF